MTPKQLGNILEFDLNLLFSCVLRVRGCLLTDRMCVKMSLGSLFVPLMTILQLCCLGKFDWTSFRLSGCFVLGDTHSNVHALSSAVKNAHICTLVRRNSHWTDAWPHTGEPTSGQPLTMMPPTPECLYNRSHPRLG